MKNRLFNFFIPVTAFFLLFSSCKEKAENTVPIPPEIQVVEVIQKDVPLYKEFVGQVYGQKDIPIRARVEGFLEGIHFEEGLMVKKGQLLYSIDPIPFQAKVNAQKSKLAEAQTMLVKARNDLNRIRPLAEKNAVSKSDLDATQAEYDAALSAVSAAKSNLHSSEIELGYTRIQSPISGVIGRTLARVGDFVGSEPNPVILNTVSKTDSVRVTFFLTESEYLFISRKFINEIKAEAHGNLKSEDKSKLELILSDGSVYNHLGTVDFMDRSVDANTGSILVQATFPNPDFLLRPGLYAKVKVNLKTARGALLVPQRCVMELQGQYSVYVVNAENKIESRQIDPLERLGDLWLIKEGLKPGDKVVLEGLQKISEGMEIKPVVTVFKSKTNQQ